MSETRTKSSRSPIWRYFEPVDQKKTKCLLCESLYSNSGNTTNLIDHLKRRHRDSYLGFLENMTNQGDTEDTEIPLAIENIKYEEDGSQVLEMDVQNENTEIIHASEEIEESSIDAAQLDGQIIPEGAEQGETEVTEEIRMVKVVNNLGFPTIVPLPHARSEVWNYFGFEADLDGHILDRSKVVCKLCASHFCYSGNTTNFYSHLKSMHSEIQMKAVPAKNSRSMKRSYASMINNDDENDPDYMSESLNISNVNDSHLLDDDSIPSRSRQDIVYVEDITQAIVDFIVTDCRPVTIAQGKGFQRLLRLLAPDYSLPDQQKLHNAVRKRYDEIVKERDQSLMDRFS